VNNYVLYKHTNKINGKIYIGKTCQSPEKRFGYNGIGYRFCTHFYYAIQKYGWDNFTHEVFLSGLSLESANKLERAFIILSKSYDSTIGYNIRKGGDGFDTECSKKLWEDPIYKQKIIDANKEIWANEEYHKKRAALYKEQWKDPDKRKRRSEQAVKRWANKEFHDKAQKAVLEACKTAVVCIETNERFESLKEACEKYSIHHSNLCRSIRSGYRSGGYHWKYAE